MLNTMFYLDEYDREAVADAVAEFERDVTDVVSNGWIGFHLVSQLEDDLEAGYPPRMALKVAYAELGSIIDERLRWQPR